MASSRSYLQSATKWLLYKTIRLSYINIQLWQWSSFQVIRLHDWKFNSIRSVQDFCFTAIKIRHQTQLSNLLSQSKFSWSFQVQLLVQQQSTARKRRLRQQNLLSWQTTVLQICDDPFSSAHRSSIDCHTKYRSEYHMHNWDSKW